MRSLGVTKLRDRVALEAVRAALEQDKFGFGGSKIVFDTAPCRTKITVQSAGGHRDIELGTTRPAGSGLSLGARARVQAATILMNVRKDQIGVVLESIKDTITVMRIDIDIGDTPEPVVFSQVLDCDTAVIENTKTSGTIARRVVQASNRNERTPRVAVHDLVSRRQHGSNDVGRRIEDAFNGRRIALIEKPLAGYGQSRHAIDVVRCVKQSKLIDGRASRVGIVNTVAQAGGRQFAMKHVVTIRAERVWIAEPVAGDLITFVNMNNVLHGRPGRFAIGAAYRIMRASLHAGSKMAQYIYTMNRVAKIIPPKRFILRDISLSFFPGAKIGVLGLNGSGKSTLLRIMAGLDTEIDGEARPQPGIKIGFLPQEPQLDPSKDVRGNVEEGVAETKGLLDRFNEISMQFAEPMNDDEMNALLEEQGKLQDAIDAAGAWELDRKLEIAADALRLPPWDADVMKLSGGERRRVALCRLLVSQPDMLLLDEPTNHLDAESVAWLERFLDEYAGTVIAVTHDRYFLDNVAGWILELDRGHGIPYEGNYSTWLEQKEKRLRHEEATEKARQRAMASELEWVRTNPKGRHAKSKARLRQFDEI